MYPVSNQRHTVSRYVNEMWSIISGLKINLWQNGQHRKLHSQWSQWFKPPARQKHLFRSLRCLSFKLANYNIFSKFLIDYTFGWYKCSQYRSGCFSVGSCINGKDSSLIPNLRSDNLADISTECCSYHQSSSVFISLHQSWSLPP